MLLDWITLILISCLLLSVALKGWIQQNKIPTHSKRFNSKNIKQALFMSGSILFFYLIYPDLFTSIRSTNIDKGFNISSSILYSLPGLFLIPIFTAFLPGESKNYPKKTIDTAKKIMGVPVSEFPDTYNETFVFTINIIVAVVAEELLCRQFFFYAFSNLTHSNGDLIVLISSLLFGISHSYQGIRGIITNTVMGLIWGKIFLITGNLLFPIILHLFINLTAVVYSIRRINDLKQLEAKKTDT